MYPWSALTIINRFYLENRFNNLEREQLTYKCSNLSLIFLLTLALNYRLCIVEVLNTFQSGTSKRIVLYSIGNFYDRIKVANWATVEWRHPKRYPVLFRTPVFVTVPFFSWPEYPLHVVVFWLYAQYVPMVNKCDSKLSFSCWRCFMLKICVL